MSRVLNLIRAISGNPATGDATATNTPAQFDSDKSLATTEFLRTRGMQSRAVFSGSATTNLSAAHIGGTYAIGGTTAGVVIQLPSVAGAPDGARICLVNTNLHNVSVIRVGAELLFLGNAGPVTSITMKPGDTLELEVYGAATGWMAVGGSAMLPKSNQFLANIAANGTQILPSGLITKWATLTTSAGGTVVWTFNEPFPTSVLSISAIPGAGNCVVGYSALGTASVTLATYTANTGAALGSIQLRPHAIGY